MTATAAACVYLRPDASARQPLPRVGATRARVRGMLVAPRPCQRPERRLRNMYEGTILIHTHRCGRESMRTTLNIDDELLEKAAEMTGTTEKTKLVRLGLEALIARESAKRLARLGGTEKQLKPVPRRRDG